MSQPVATSIFSNCSTHYDWEIVFEYCTNATNPCKSVQQIETSIIIAYVDYYSSVTLFSIAGLINIYCLLIIIPLYRKMQDGTKKKYIFLITRCIAGLLTSCAWLLIQCIYLRFIAPTSGNFPYYVLALALYIGSTYVLLGSYVGMAAILYLGVLNPIAFNQYLKLRTVYIAVCVIFLTAIVLSIPLATLQAAIAIPTASVKCTDKSCAPLITLINLILVSGSLLITIISSSFVLISLKRHRKQFKKLDTVSNTSLNSALRLLSWTLFAEILISVAEIIPFVFMEYKKHQRSTSGCYWFNHASRVVSEASFALIESSIWSIALIIDPLTNVILDTTVSKKATSQIKWAQKSFVGLARNMTGKFSRRRITNGKETQVCQEEQIIQLDTISSIT